MKKQTTIKPSIKSQPHARKVGRLVVPVAKAIGQKAADIYITENYIKHIFIGHEVQLRAIGYTPLEFVEVVVKDYNRIYKGRGQSILLVRWNGVPQVAAIELNMAFRDEFYEVKTAFVKQKRQLKDENLLWKKN